MNNQRHAFFLDEDMHYLNNAYKALMLRSNETVLQEAFETEKYPMKRTVNDFFGNIDLAHQLFGRLVNCPASQVALIPSTSYAFANALNNVSCKPGQHALTIEAEFPSDYFALNAWCEKNQAELRTIQSGEQSEKNWNERIIEAIDSQTAVVVMSAIHWMHGFVFDLEAIGRACKEVGAVFMVDGTQSVGARPMDVTTNHIDVLVCAGYKWLLGPYSLGCAYYSEQFDNGRPIENSWMNRKNARGFSDLTDYSHEYVEGAGRYNVGETSNFLLLPILINGLKQVLDWRVEEIMDYTSNLVAPFRGCFEAMGIPMVDEKYFAPHLFGLKVPHVNNVQALADDLKAENVIVSVRGTSLRVSVNVFNTAEDLEALIQVIERTS